MSGLSISVFELLRRAFFLLVALGILVIFLPLRAQAEGFSIEVLGLLGTTYGAGFITGCLFTPRFVRLWGSLHVFDLLLIFSTVSTLLMFLYIHEGFWMVVRFLGGFTFSGCLMVIESSLNAKAENKNRGFIFGLYMALNNIATVLGYMIVTKADIAGPNLFLIASIFFCISFLPFIPREMVSTHAQETEPMNLKCLYSISPTACISCFLIGIFVGAWVSFAPVYGVSIGLGSSDIAWMMLLALTVGSLMQVPIGYMSDRMDRHFLLMVMSLLSAFSSLLIFLLVPRSFAAVLAMTGFYGAATATLYTITVGCANDCAKKSSFAAISAGLLLFFGAGSVMGPMIATWFMKTMRPEALFLVPMLSCALLAFRASLHVMKKI